MSSSGPSSDKGISSLPPEAWSPLIKLKQLTGKPLERFLKIEAASGILLILAAAIALVWANSPWKDAYQNLWQLPLAMQVGSFHFERSLEWVVNDGLMAIFFFVIGLEIRREMHRGELSEWRRAALPAAAAVGGMVAPAAFYLILAGAPDTRSGWGVPMATDIAFAIGILTLLGKRVPAALRVLLLTVAVIDDLGAIIVIALFYSSGISISGLIVAAASLAVIFSMQRLGLRSKIAYIFPAIVTWAGIYAAGVHPTIAGVIVGLITPVAAWLGPQGFIESIHGDLEHIENSAQKSTSTHELAASLQHLNSARREVLSPADSLIETLHPWVAFIIMPIFALANAGVSLSGLVLDDAATKVAFAIAAGLLVGKPVGILLLSWATIRARVAILPAGITFRHLTVLGLVAGIGFTMSLFIAQLAFRSEILLASAKLGVLAASGAAAVLALVIGRMLLSTDIERGAARSADEAESSTQL